MLVECRGCRSGLAVVAGRGAAAHLEPHAGRHECREGDSVTLAQAIDGAEQRRDYPHRELPRRLPNHRIERTATAVLFRSSPAFIPFFDHSFSSGSCLSSAPLGRRGAHFFLRRFLDGFLPAPFLNPPCGVGAMPLTLRAAWIACLVTPNFRANWTSVFVQSARS